MISPLRTAAQKMMLDFESTRRIPHNLMKGEAREAIVLRDFLRPYLPTRYSVAKAIIIDIEDKSSKQQDLVIYDAFASPILEDLNQSLLLFPESVFATIEVKSCLTKAELSDIVGKSTSVWELKKTAHPTVHVTLSQLLGLRHIPILCFSICFESSITIEDARDELRSIRATELQSHALSFVSILKDKDGKAGIILSVDPKDLQRVTLIPSTDSRLGVLQCDSPGDVLLQTYLLLMEHLRNCGFFIPMSNLLEYAKVAGFGSQTIQMSRDDVQGAYAVVEGQQVSIDAIRDMSEWTRLLYSGQINDDQMLDLFVHLAQMSSGEILLDPRCVFKVNGAAIGMPGTLAIVEAIRRQKAGNPKPDDKTTLAAFVTLVRNVIQNKLLMEMSPA